MPLRGGGSNNLLLLLLQSITGHALPGCTHAHTHTLSITHMHIQARTLSHTCAHIGTLVMHIMHTHTPTQ